MYAAEENPPTPDDDPATPDEDPITPDIVAVKERPDHGSGVRPRTYVALAVVSALVSAITTVALLWLTGVLDPEVVRITEIVEVAEVGKVPATGTKSAPAVDDGPDPAPIESSPAPSEAPNQLGDTVLAPTELVPTDLVTTVAALTIPSIVTVQRFDEDLRPAATGSGVIISPDGFIVTNDHVIDNADTLKVLMYDGLSYPATLMGTDPLLDIAVLKVEASGLIAIEFGSMEDLRIGEPAIAVGNPLGLDGGPSVTAGVISAFDRALVTDPFTGATMYGLLQTDAPITRGSSGGALLDVHGRLLGITTAIGLSDLGAEGLGFAVPINLVEGVVDDLISDGGVRHAFLGIQGASAFTERKDGVESPLGVKITLLDDSAIGRAGAEDDDVIVALDGEPVRSTPLLIARLRSYRAGDPIEVTVDRDGEKLDLNVVLDLYPS